MNEKINKKEVNKMITTEQVINYNNKTITINEAIKCMDGKGGYTKEYLQTKTNLLIMLCYYILELLSITPKTHS